MDRHAGPLPEDAGQMERGRVHGPGDVVERDALAQPARDVGLGRLGAVGVIGVGGGPPSSSRQAEARERGGDDVGDEPEGRHVGAERVGVGGLQAADELAVPPEDGRLARAGGGGERTVGVVVDRGVERADDVEEHARRGRERRAAVAAVGGMADAVGRPLREEHGLVGVGDGVAPAEVPGERAPAEQDDAVGVGVFLGLGAAAAGPAAVVAHDDGALVERAEREPSFVGPRHAHRGT